MKNPYDILGMPAGSDSERLKNRYNELKAIYSEQRFEDGERGNEGARLLSELEASWVQIEQELKSSTSKREFGGDYGEIENLIKTGDYDYAQKVMDSITDRDARWHYFQSIIFYKRDWLSESRAQLVIALQKDPNNAKYQESLRKLDLVMGNAQTRAQDIGRGQQGPYADNRAHQTAEQPQQQSDAESLCANCVCAYCMTELCCTMIRCCH